MRRDVNSCAHTSFAKTQITGVVWYLGVRQDVTAASEVHRHSRRNIGRNRQVVLGEDNDVYSCQRGSRTFAATHCNHHFLSTVRTVVSLWLWWCLRYIRLLSFAEGVIVFSSPSLTLTFSLWPPNRNRADTRRELIDFKPFNISHVLTDVPNGENFNEVRMLHSEVSDMDDLDLSTVGQHLGSPRMTTSDATRFTETRDEEARQGEGEARRRRGLETGRWNTTQGAE